MGPCIYRRDDAWRRQWRDTHRLSQPGLYQQGGKKLNPRRIRMVLHHGTSLTRAREAAIKGLLPRKLSGRNSFPCTPAHEDCIYMSDTYPLYFAENARRQDRDDFAVVFSIDTSLLNENCFLPDEDVLEQINRGADDLPASLSASERTALYRRSLSVYAGSDGWQDSLKLLGTCAYRGRVLPHAFVSVAVVDVQAQRKLMMWATDFSVSLAHFRSAAGVQRTLTHRVTTGAWPMVDIAVERSLPEPLRNDINSCGGITVFSLKDFRVWVQQQHAENVSLR